MSKKIGWNGGERASKTPEQHIVDREYEAMSTEDKRVVHRKQFVGFLKIFQGEGPICYINGKPQDHIPMSKEEADLHLALYDGDIEPTEEVRLELAQLELIRHPKSKKLLGKLWKLTEKIKDK